MIKSSLNKINIGLVFSLASLFLSLTAFSSAQAGMIISWQSNTLTPQIYQGKHLPTINSPIKASLDLIDNNKTIDISNETIYWYLNNKFIAGGKGFKSVIFKAPGVAGGNLELRAEMPNKDILKTVNIPVVPPEVVIDSPYYSGIFSTPAISLKGVPYFFNTVDDINLTYHWDVNGNAPQENGDPQILNINLNDSTPQNFKIDVSLSVSNNIKPDETGNANITFTYKK